MDARTNELLLDLEEIKKFEASAQRESIRGKLAIWRSEVERELAELKRKTATPAEVTQVTNHPPKPKVFTKKITTYAWDQSDKFVKIFLSGLNGIQNIPKEGASLAYDGHHYTLNISDLNKSNYQFSVPKLLHEVTDASLKIKTDEVVIMLRKASPKSWETLSEKEKLEKDDKKKMNEPNLGKNDDPSKGIMDMMKKMYEEGDDDMKRTIAKAWTESRDKQTSGME